MMKNTVIGLLIIVVGVLGYLLYANLNQDAESDSTPNSVTSSESANDGSQIQLANKNLSEVPKDILDDSSVTSMDVSGNNLTGALPAEIRKLTNLESLDASNNKLTGIPAEIGQLKKLRSINFANNDISGLPLELGNLSNLETLDLRGNPNVSAYDISQIQPKIPNASILTD